ncbi:MAG TPA: endonuclease III domain-containing protein [Candidatus Polarisedimenticolia bacterium]|nr:endonuclease III domain-containing protein [Candidatus Polarisedimenticolia bacterium]
MPIATGRGPLLRYFQAMLREYGPQRWWPARSRFEIVVGAILTQNTAWTNVEKGIEALRSAGLLDPAAMARSPRARLAALIRPTGYFNQKAARLHHFLSFLEQRHGGDLDRLLAQPVAELRRQLLDLSGIGPETADSIILYAAARPMFVIDAYTRRILGRHGLVAADERYDRMQRQLHDSLPADAGLFNEYHALLVRIGKEHCLKASPRCGGCPLEPLLPAGGAVQPKARRRPPARAVASRREDADPDI